jgi:YesN/AraC family two-component response regulator
MSQKTLQIALATDDYAQWQVERALIRKRRNKRLRIVFEETENSETEVRTINRNSRQEIVKHMDEIEHFARQGKTLKTISAILGVAESSVGTVFRDVKGITFNEYKKHLREEVNQ